MKSGKGKGGKLYIIGIDSAPLWLIKDNINKYRLGGFKRMVESGALTEMESTLPPMTGPAWPSIYTGFRPGTHGVPDFFRLEKDYEKKLVFFNADVSTPFWDALAKKGVKSLVITPAMVIDPSTEKNVDMMTGFPLPPKFSSDRVRGAASKHRYKGEPDIEGDMRNGKMDLKEASSKYVKSINARSAIAKDLITNNNYDLSFICFTETDRMQHFSLNNPKWRDYIMPVYENISDFMLWILDRAEKEGSAVILVSDHGAQPIHDKFLINAWLINNGYAKLKESVIQHDAEKAARSGSMRYKAREALMKSGLRKGVYDKLPKNIKKAAKGILQTTLSGSSGEDYTRIHDFDLDMQNTKAFASISNGPVCTIYINDSRFSNGIVTTKERKALKAKLMRDLADIKCADNKKLAKSVMDAASYYGKTKLFITPDIMAEARPGYMLDIFGYLKGGGLVMKPEISKSGDHTRNGVFGIIDYGRDRDYKKIMSSKIYVYNVQPTVMNLFGTDPKNDKRYKPLG